MIKIARLPNPTFAVADLAPSAERLSRVPPRDTDAGNRPPALSKPAGRRSTGVEAMKMRAKYLILAIALLCLLALPATALAADEQHGGKIDPSVTTVARGAPAATRPSPSSCTRTPAPHGRRRRRRAAAASRSTTLPVVDAVAAYLTPDEIDALAGERLRRSASSPTTRSSAFDYRELDGRHQPHHRSRQGDAARRRRPHGRRRRVAILDSGVATHLRPRPTAASSAGRTSSTGKKTPYDDAGHGTFVAGLIAGDGTASLPLEDGGFATMQFRGVAPRRRHRRRQGARQHRPGARLHGHRRHRSGPSPTRTSTTSACSTSRSAATRSAPVELRPDRPGRRGRLDDTASRSCAPPATRASSAPAASSPRATTPTSSPSAPTDTRQTADARRRRRRRLQLASARRSTTSRQARPRRARQPR